MNTSYFKQLKNCKDYCLFDENNDKIEDCIDTIYNDNNIDRSIKICLNDDNTICNIDETKDFKNLILFFIKYFKFLYCSRKFYKNAYDDKIALTIGLLDLSLFNININELDCLKFPGDNSYVNEFPNNFKDYLIIMQELYKIRDSITISTIKNNPFLIKFSNFCLDYQPWNRTLSVFINKYSQKFFNINIPKIEKPNNYGNFIDKCDINSLDILFNDDNFQQYLIKYLLDKKDGGRKKSRKSKRRIKKKKIRSYRKN
jgi:hypothetical protein